MNIKINKENLFILTMITLLIVVYYFLQDINIDSYVNLIMFSIIYLIIIISILKINKFDFMAVPVLYIAFFSKDIGISPIVYTLSNGKFVPNQYFLILLATLFFLIGNIIYDSVKKKDIIHKEKNIDYKKMQFYGIILIIISIIANIIYLYKNYNILFSSNIEDGRIEALSGNGLMIQLMNCGAIGLGILYECVLDGKMSKKIFCIFAIIVLPLTLLKGFRSNLAILLLILCFMYNKTKKISNWNLIKIAIVIIILVVVIGTMRSGTTIINSFIAMLRNGSINLASVLRCFPQYKDFQYGYTYLINIIMLKPGPDLDFTLWLKDSLQVSFNGGGVTPTIIGEFYINFGFYGVIIGMFLISIITKKIERLYNYSNQIYYSSFLVCMLINTTGGGIANIELTLLFTSIFYFIIMIASKKSGKRSK